MCVICKGTNLGLQIHCNKCPKLKKISNIKRIEELNCYDCCQLKEISNIQDIEYINCSCCLKLKKILNVEHIGILSCPHCPKLSKLKIKNIGILNCTNCFKLKKIYNIRYQPIKKPLTTIYCQGCPYLTQILNIDEIEVMHIDACPFLYLPKEIENKIAEKGVLLIWKLKRIKLIVSRRVQFKKYELPITKDVLEYIIYKY